MNSKVIAFLHIPKTSGSTVLKQIHKNLKPGEYLELNTEALGVKETDGYGVYLKAAKALIEEIKATERRRVKIIYGHCIPYGIHEVFEKEMLYVTLFRDPESRVLSVYNFLRTLAAGGDIGLEERLDEIFYVKGRIPSFERWFGQKFNKSEDFALMSTDNILKKFGYSRDLQQFYFVGDMEREEDRLFMYSMLGIEKLFINQNVSKKYYLLKNVAGKYKEELAGAYSVYNTAQVKGKKFRKDNKFYVREVERIRKKEREIFLNQLLYDFIPTLKHIKHRLSLKL